MTTALRKPSRWIVSWGCHCAGTESARGGEPAASANSPFYRNHKTYTGIVRVLFKTGQAGQLEAVVRSNALRIHSVTRNHRVEADRVRFRLGGVISGCARPIELAVVV